MKQLTILVTLLVFAATAARSEPESSGKPDGMDPATIALPEYQVEAPEAPRPLPVILEVPVPRAECLIEEIAPPKSLLAVWVRDEASEA